MNKNKSNAAYTNKWLNRNKSYWYEEQKEGYLKIKILKKDAPRRVLKRVKTINLRRFLDYIYKKYNGRKIETMCVANAENEDFDYEFMEHWHYFGDFD